TGHSLGGALAQLASLNIEILFGHISPVIVYVFGCPRVGEARFCKFYNTHIRQNCYRVVYEADPITTLPRGFKLFKHVGIEYIVNHTGDLIVNPSKGEKKLLPQRTNILDHSLYRYAKGINQYFLNNEKLKHKTIQFPPQIYIKPS